MWPGSHVREQARITHIAWRMESQTATLSRRVRFAHLSPGRMRASELSSCRSDDRPTPHGRPEERRWGIYIAKRRARGSPLFGQRACCARLQSKVLKREKVSGRAETPGALRIRKSALLTGAVGLTALRADRHGILKPGIPPAALLAHWLADRRSARATLAGGNTLLFSP